MSLILSGCLLACFSASANPTLHCRVQNGLPGHDSAQQEEISQQFKRDSQGYSRAQIDYKSDGIARAWVLAGEHLGRPRPDGKPYYYIRSRVFPDPTKGVSYSNAVVMPNEEADNYFAGPSTGGGENILLSFECSVAE